MIAKGIEIDGLLYDLPSGASAVVDGNNLIINNGNVNNLKSSQLVTETMTVTTNQYGWIYFPENLLVINASVSDMYKKLVLVKYDRTNSYQYIAASYLETNGVISYTKLTANKSYEVTYTYLKDVPISTGHNYSTEEKIVGTWIDGRTIYEKTVEIPELPNNTRINISQCDGTLIDAKGYCYSKTDPTSIRLIPFAAGGANDIRVDQTEGYIRVWTFADWRTYAAYVTYQYTKN